MTMKPHLNKYHSLPGVKGGELIGPMAKTVNGFMTALKSFRAVADAGDHGSVMVYIDDNGTYCGFFMKYHQTQASVACNTKSDMRKWLKEWLPKQRNADAA